MKFGLLVGLLSPIVGFIIYGLYWSWSYGRTFSYFVNDIFIGTPAHRSSIIVLSLLINLVPFLVLLRQERYKAARGILAAIFIFVPFVVYFKFSI